MTPARLLLLTASLGSVALAATLPGVAPVPPVQRGIPGAVQPRPPGYRTPAPLPTLQIRTPGVKKVEYLSNGFIEVAHVLLLMPAGQDQDAPTLALAQQAVAATFQARPGLAEVDLSAYAAGRYAGFGGPAPLLTASVPVAQQAAFAALGLPTVGRYDRLWLASRDPGVTPAAVAAYEGREVAPTYVGSAKQTLLQRLAQLLSGTRGSRPDASVFYQGAPSVRQMAPTFDDGVHPLYEPLILDALRRGGARATFFIVGRNARAYPYFVRDIAAQGHEIANHTFHHVRLPALSAAAIRQELSSTDTLLSRLSGQDVRYFRPPGGRFSARVLNVARAEGLTTAMWTDDPGDFNNLGQPKVEMRLLNHVRPGGIVLLHENVPDTVRLMTDFINDARGTGYRLTTLGGLAGAH
jgi:peptidoglycan-N-acetylglucosamine deacetylase